MGPSGLSLSTLLLLLIVFIIHVAFVSCTEIVHANFPATSTLRGNETDRLALLVFKARVTEDPLGVLSSWNVSVHHCQWQGVTCGHRHQRVIKLDLQSEKLVGSLTPHVGNLSFLRALYLQNNSITGIIPSELGRLRRLRYLRLSDNSMIGAIPANISSCSNLVTFALDFNKLVGEIPMEIGSLLKLKLLYVHRNNLTGRIPPSLGNLTSLQEIFTTHNNLSGSIPDVLGKLKSLTTLGMGNNSLTGTLPPSIFNLSSIKIFSLPLNQIQGCFPSNLGIIWPNLKILNIAFNNFTGSIPVSLSNATNLVELSSPKNKLIGKVPNFGNLYKFEILNLPSNLLGAREANDLSFFSSLRNASNLKFVFLDDNNFGGMLPQSISNLSTTLERLSLSINNIYGIIPPGLANLVHLQILYLWANLFTGNIPAEIGKLRELQMLDLSQNVFFGNIPSSIGNLTLLINIFLENNNLEGSIPSNLGECQKLLAMDLSWNNLTGKIPLKVLGITSLSLILDLSHNHLSGSLSTEVGNLKNLGMLDISRNLLSGEIPRTLGSCLSLEILYMAGNNFQGIIPFSLSTLRGLRRLDLSSNNLSGPIPNYFEGFDLQYLNLSFNDFDGAVPKEGIFKNKSAVFINGNNKLCGGAPELELSKCNTEGSKKRKLIFALKLSISIISGVAGLSLLLCLLIFYCSKRTKKESSFDTGEKLVLKVSYQILIKATDGFSAANMIGSGSFGSVYKGILDQGKTIIAVKVLNLSRQGASKSFIAECDALRNIRHRNLVKVLSACSGVDYQGNDFKALVYEFMVNGSLEKWLHPISSDDEIPEKLNFLQRLNVAIDVACALDYLHHGCHAQIVHCDLKPSNVLLDNEMVAHVGDFGLAKFIQEATSNSSVDQANSVGIRGSIGYTAPEYGMGSKVSTCGDVYSYGIFVLEMFTGKRPTDEMFKDRENLHNYAKNALPVQVADIADPFILQEIKEEKARVARSTKSKGVEECLISVIEVGVACSEEVAKERMNMSDVTAQLHLIKDIFLGTRIHMHRETKSTQQHGGN